MGFEGLFAPKSAGVVAALQSLFQQSRIEQWFERFEALQKVWRSILRVNSILTNDDPFSGLIFPESFTNLTCTFLWSITADSNPLELRSHVETSWQRRREKVGRSLALMKRPKMTNALSERGVVILASMANCSSVMTSSVVAICISLFCIFDNENCAKWTFVVNFSIFFQHLLELKWHYIYRITLLKIMHACKMWPSDKYIKAEIIIVLFLLLLVELC